MERLARARGTVLGAIVLAVWMGSFACRSDVPTSSGKGSTEAGECRSNAECSGTEFCDLPAGSCGARETIGRCVDRPEICTMQWDPVCGCDGRTYSNDCQRRAAGVPKDRGGECASTGR